MELKGNSEQTNDNVSTGEVGNVEVGHSLESLEDDHIHDNTVAEDCSEAGDYIQDDEEDDESAGELVQWLSRVLRKNKINILLKCQALQASAVTC